MIVGIMEQICDHAIHERRALDAMFAFRKIARDERVDEEIRKKAAKLEIKAKTLAEMIDERNTENLKEKFEKIKAGDYLY